MPASCSLCPVTPHEEYGRGAERLAEAPGDRCNGTVEFATFQVPPMHVELLVENKRSNVKRLVIRRQAVIGRQAHCDIRVVSTEISREHCRIEIRDEGPVLVDLGSTNGTFINRKRVETHDEVLLHDGDVILIGPAAFSVHVSGAPTATSADSLDGVQAAADSPSEATVISEVAEVEEAEAPAPDVADESPSAQGVVETEEDSPHVINGEETNQPFETAILGSANSDPAVNNGDAAAHSASGQRENPLLDSEDRHSTDTISEDELGDLLNNEDEESSSLAGITSDHDSPTLSDDDAFEKFLKDM